MKNKKTDKIKSVSKKVSAKETTDKASTPTPVMKKDIEMSTPALLKMKHKSSVNLHGAAARVYMSLYAQNFTGEEILELADEKYKYNQTVLERIVIEELARTQSNDEKVKLDSQRYVLNFLNKGEIKNMPTEEKDEKFEENLTLLDTFMDGIVEGIIESENEKK